MVIPEQQNGGASVCHLNQSFGWSRVAVVEVRKVA